MSTKYSAGSVLVLGGAPGFTGAPALAALAALRAGAGIAWVGAPAEVCDRIARSHDEVMVHAWPDALELVERAGAVALGPGLGRAAESLQDAADLAAAVRKPLVLDADGLHAVAGKLESLSRRRQPTVLTPHEGEMAALLGETTEWVRENRLTAVRTAARLANAVVLLKGADTLVAEAGRAPGGGGRCAQLGAGYGGFWRRAHRGCGGVPGEGHGSVGSRDLCRGRARRGGVESGRASGTHGYHRR